MKKKSKSKKPAAPAQSAPGVITSKADLGVLFESRRQQLLPGRQLQHFAQLVEIEKSAYYRIEQGASWPQLKGLLRILDALKLDLTITPKKGSEALPSLKRPIW